MFDEMKRKLTELFSQGSWSSEDDKQKAISTVSNMKVAIMDSESLSEEYKGRDKILENKLSADNYFINAYYSMKAKFLTSLKATSHRNELPGFFTFQPHIFDKNLTVVMTSGLLHPPFLNTSQIMPEKYGILGWLLGRQIMSAVFRNEHVQNQSEYQSKCSPYASTPLRTQLCCLSEQINSERLQKENLEQLSAGINGLMLSFETYKRSLTGKRESLNEKKLFFSAFAKMVCGGLSSQIVDDDLRSSIQVYKSGVNDVVKHSGGFSETYQCKSGSAMNPMRKCIL
ncbi:hypothetical protein MS3_00000216 [Schistosoma haematobium]|uniref:Peptidase M13 C-terminal domain-containing protein n=1 Tax=Schistosoma haematobium TaxID=6185 RepID=A0A922LHA4_SCHHA|nr:hypothetical protein MS3_00000216 [Schistosoma haematobium]KAH9584452.1 hypothetical protein MS3_00000216 [Schistosoma haematobium]